MRKIMINNENKRHVCRSDYKTHANNPNKIHNTTTHTCAVSSNARPLRRCSVASVESAWGPARAGGRLLFIFHFILYFFCFCFFSFLTSGKNKTTPSSHHAHTMHTRHTHSTHTFLPLLSRSRAAEQQAKIGVSVV